MPSVPHEILVDLFRTCEELAPELLKRCADLELAHDRAELGSIDLSQVVSTEYRADAVIILHEHSDAARVVEVQLNVDTDKLRTWPQYVTALRAARRCPVVLLVVAPDLAVARGARAPIEIGHPGFCLTPLVIGFDQVPRVVDAELARRLPELSVLSAMAHPELAVAATAIDAITLLPEDQNRLYCDVILSGLPDAIRAALEAQMQGYEYQSEFARRYYGQGHEEGRKEGQEQGRKEGQEQGRKEGQEQGRKEGQAQGLRAALLAVARAKLNNLTAADEVAIAALHEEYALTELVSSLSRATSARDARAVLELAVRATSPTGG